MTWFDRLVAALERMPIERLTLLRDVVDALVARRRGPPIFPNIESALHEAVRHAAELKRAAPLPMERA